MLDRLPVELIREIAYSYFPSPFETEELVKTLCRVNRRCRETLDVLRLPHLSSPETLALAEARPELARNRAKTLLVGTPHEPEHSEIKWGHHWPIAPADVSRFLELFPYAREAFLVDLVEESMVDNHEAPGEPVSCIALQDRTRESFRNYVALCFLNVALYIPPLEPTHTFAVKHFRLDVVGHEPLVRGLERFLTEQYVPNLRTLRLSISSDSRTIEHIRLPSLEMDFLNRLQAIQVTVPFGAIDQPGLDIPATFLTTSTPVLFTSSGHGPTSVHPHIRPLIRHVHYTAHDFETPYDLQWLADLPNLRAVFIPRLDFDDEDPDLEGATARLETSLKARGVEFILVDSEASRFSYIEPAFEQFLLDRKE